MNKNNKHLYTSKIIKAPALLNDTKIFLSYWNEALSVDKNIQKAIEGNILGRPSRTYAKQFVSAFRERYIFGDGRDKALRNLVRKGDDNSVTNKILYYHTALADPLVYDFVVHYLYEMHSSGAEYIGTKDAQEYIKKLSDEGKTVSPWNDTVCNRTARNILASLRDFQILEGNAKKRIAPVFLPVKAFVYIAFTLSSNVKAGDKIINHQDWKLYLLDAMTVERLFLEAHQQGFVHFQSAGNLARIKFQFQSIEEVVDAIVS